MQVIITVLAFYKQDFDYLPCTSALCNALLGKTKEDKWTCHGFHASSKRFSPGHATYMLLPDLIKIYDANCWDGIENSMWWNKKKNEFDLHRYNLVAFTMLVFGWAAWIVSQGFDHKDKSSFDIFESTILDMFNATWKDEHMLMDPIFREMLDAAHHLYTATGWDGDNLDKERVGKFFGEREIKMIRDRRAGF